MSQISRVGVVGAGTMGHGIAEVVAIAGFNVVLTDVNEDILRNALEKIRWSLEKLREKRQIKENPNTVLSRIKTTVSFGDFSDVDFIIEAAIERSDVKRKIFSELDRVVKKDAIFATNTSTIPISYLAEVTGRQEKFIGLHFMNPPVLMPLVEIIMGNKTAEETLKTTIDLAKKINKDYVVVKKDVPGFLINRINGRTFPEAVLLYDEGYSKEDIDAMSRFRLGMPMGFLELMDFTGIDVAYNAGLEAIKRGEGEPPHFKVLKKLVEEGRLGIKSGKGFYTYTSKTYERARVVPTDNMYYVNPLRIIAPAVNEAAWILRNDVSSAQDIEKGMVKGMNWPQGPLTFADKYGIDNVLKFLEERYEVTKNEYYKPDPLLTEMVSKGKLGVKSGEGFFKWNYEKANFGPVKYEKLHDYAKITMSRADKLNALNEAMWSGLTEAFKKAKDDSEIRAVVITGEGRAFCAGDDIEMMNYWGSVAGAMEWNEKFSSPLINLLLNYPKPVISAVNGLAFGGGMELNILFDIIVASDDAMFAIPEGLIGALPPLASSMGVGFISRKIARYALTGDWMSAKQAKELGLVDIVVPHDQLEIATVEIVEKAKKIAPLSSMAIKRAVNSIRNSYLQQLQSASQDLLILSATEDFKEGMRAFVERRQPKYKGK
ncbi:3-hydroxyacyl-CoA dehydrogenase/enoyl-CoA hydratase family protein [Sulfolobus acidocaldarius]|uniref:3-hydroxybutyryl-CoA dehydrogenase n=4 Tax=Sulfolobus acidocaldarius TaxID=2285 RepID=Q4J6T7_SULAC|nr:3-hydroxyacyl-CoA dehydrogenase/enoyl-CoA hydratase family protein [Sulfolobus acidocaldarius]AAY81494.1 3-hydroxybutyryl-CoA dehydrogenase [Sulfolobus acidocaldarius DSM 639]AGE72099.1 3-hydroxybutyryl-CoA dehydrogenase [Sulfolobus acidocaldarius N8]AGE74416.1 3-hydroxybutyryl-CoA dehydrogenase [Sulfolobus acidocaldarius Ron12/I]ALU29723.1 3-hydroxyacyl-CoA dehydrogenase [Sulfolobus acidocaldarius]ALU32457.1 3-hydroxyacyl-CoA dehydrogenase [Sulfolobus acidocaldarius]